jgi:hypothetical protein
VRVRVHGGRQRVSMRVRVHGGRQRVLTRDRVSVAGRKNQ